MAATITKKTARYKLVHGDLDSSWTQDAFARIVERELQHGWILHGGPFSKGVRVYQAMIQEEVVIDIEVPDE